MTRRDKVEIYRDILKYLLEHGKSVKTRVLRSATGNPAAYQPHLDTLLYSGLIRQHTGESYTYYTITDKGINWITDLDKIYADLKPTTGET